MLQVKDHVENGCAAQVTVQNAYIYYRLTSLLLETLHASAKKEGLLSPQPAKRYKSTDPRVNGHID